MNEQRPRFPVLGLIVGVVAGLMIGASEGEPIAGALGVGIVGLICGLFPSMLTISILVLAFCSAVFYFIQSLL